MATSSRSAAERASSSGVGELFGDLQRARKGYGLNSDVRPTYQLAASSARSLGVSTASRLPVVTVNSELLADRVRAQLDAIDATEAQRTLAQVAWNIGVHESHDIAKSIAPSRDRLTERYRHLKRLNLSMRRAVIEPTSLTDEKSFRGAVDDLILQLVQVLPKDQMDQRVSFDDGQPRRSSNTLELPTGATTAQLLRSADSHAQRFLHEDAPHAKIDQVSDLATALSTTYSFLQPAIAFAQALELLRSCEPLLLRTQDPAARADLNVVLGIVYGILSYAALDLGDAQRALMHAMSATRAGEIAEQDDIQAWGLGTQSMILRFEQKFKQSLGPSERALNLKLSPMMETRVKAQLILGHSELHNVDKMEGLVSEIESTVEAQQDGSGMATGIFSFPRSKVHYYVGSGYLGLGPGFREKAARHSAAAIELFQFGSPYEQSYTDELLARIHLATSELRSDELDAVPATLNRLFEAEAGSRTSWHSQWLNRLSRFLRSNPRYQGSSVQGQLDELIAEFDLGVGKEQN